MVQIPDDPIISCMERTGYPPRPRKREPICPICGAACDFVYKDGYHEIVGCNECLTSCDAEDEEECFPVWEEEE